MLYATQGDSEWWAYGRDTFNNRYSPLRQITRENFSSLELVAQWHLPSNDIPMGSFPNKQFGPNEGTPIKVGRYLYTVTAASQVAKFDLETLAPATDDTGAPVVFDPKIYEHYSVSQIGFVHRGLIYWHDKQGKNARLFLAQGDARLLALDPDTLKPIADFGVAGEVQFHQHRTTPGAPLRYCATSPPIVCNGVVIVGSTIPDLVNDCNPPKGNVQAFDALTGAPRWSFNTVPSNQEMVALGLDPDDEWANNANATAGQSNVWTVMSADESLGLVYLPIGSANNDSYGGHRLGNNLFSHALVALEVATGKVRWYQQLVRHGLWDYDLPAAPNLVDIKVNGRVEKLVVQVSKQAFAYVFNREDGTPRWELVEVATAASGVPGEQAAPTQRVPRKPLPFDRQGVYREAGQDLLGRPVEANIFDFSPASRTRTLKVLDQYVCGPLFTPPVMKTEAVLGTLQLPGYLGGASWAGAVVNPENGQLYVSSVTEPYINAVEATPDNPDADAGRYNYFVVNPANWRPRDPAHPSQTYPLPLFQPPWGRITAIDLYSGDHAWASPVAVGQGPRDMLARWVGEEHLPDELLGWNRRTHLLVTPTLLIGCQEPGRQAFGYSDEGGDILMYSLLPEDPLQRTLNAYDPQTGELLASLYVPGQAQGALMSFEYRNQQYIAYPVGGYNLTARVLLFRLPEQQGGGV